MTLPVCQSPLIDHTTLTSTKSLKETTKDFFVWVDSAERRAETTLRRGRHLHTQQVESCGNHDEMHFPYVDCAQVIILCISTLLISCVLLPRLRVEFLLKPDSGCPNDTGVTKNLQPMGIPFSSTPLAQLHQGL